MPTLTREELYDLVWTEPVRTLAKRFSVSDVWLKKCCAKASVPTPDRGYWAKLAARKRVVRARLPPREPGQAERISISKVTHSWRWDPEAELTQPIPDPPVFEDPLDAVRERVEKTVGKIARSRDLASSIVPIRKLLDQDERRRAKMAKETYTFAWDKPRFDSGFEQRRLRVLNALGFGLARGGAKLHVGGKTGREVQAHVGDRVLTVQLDHPSAKPDQWGQPAVREGPADTLKLELKPRWDADIPVRTWTDCAEGKLEDQLTDIVVALIVAGEADHRNAAVAHREHLIKRREDNLKELERRRLEAERRERERRLAEEKARREHLFGQAKDWRTAEDIRAFVREVMAAGGGDEVERWAAWALAEAQLIDPRGRPLLPEGLNLPGGDDGGIAG